MRAVDVLEGYTTGVFQSNCYVVAARRSEGAVVIDAGQDANEVVLARLAEHGLRCEAVLLTHGHIDHVWSAAAISEASGAPAFIHPADRYMLDDPGAALGRLGMDSFDVAVPKDVRDIADGDVFDFGGVRIEARHTPGHTPGHCVFLTDGIVFSGDLIFAGSVGRTDFPRGSFEELIESIKRVILPLDDATTIVSGHGPATTVGAERATNPFILSEAAAPKPRGL
jgi:hydroxyacylglutathione hydrolase